MFNTGEKFDYFQCGSCQTLQIITPPDNLGEYYPPAYYQSRFSMSSKLRSYLRQKRDLYSYGNRSILGALLTHYSSVNYNVAAFRWLEQLQPLFPTSWILDVGCGNGNFLSFLEILGYQHLYGLDPFLPASRLIGRRNNIVLLKEPLEKITLKFDLIVLNHSLEHMSSPQLAFTCLTRMLNPGGHILLRLPLVNFAWEKYRENWVQLDAPRHLFIPSRRGIELLCSQHGLTIQAVMFDSSAFQFIGSEKYQRSLALAEPLPNTGKTVADYQREAIQLNVEERGDQACFLLAISPATDSM